MNNENKLNDLQAKAKELSFSGAFYATNGTETLQGSNGFANRSEKVLNHVDTRFAVASGSKLFTAVAICMLVEEGKISFQSKLKDCLDIDFPHFDENITIHQLLTHTSGVPDYFDEDVMEDYESLWETRPMYHIRSPKDFLPMFQHEKMQAKCGSSFHYNNTGYLLLGLVVEQLAECNFSDFVEERIFRKAGMDRSGYFEMDRLPEKTALGYIEEEDGSWKTNIYSLPVKGGPDGGVYVSVKDIALFWQALKDHQLLSKKMTEALFKPREVVDEEDDIYYGYCGFMELDSDGQVVKYIQMGYDPGVNYRSVYNSNTGTTIVVCSNESEGAYELLKAIEEIL